MWQRIFRELSIQFYWFKRDLVQRWRLDTPGGIVGILVLISGIVLLMTLGQGLARIFRNTIPWVTGGNMETVYWQSMIYKSFGIKVGAIVSANLLVGEVPMLELKRSMIGEPMAMAELGLFFTI